jgi:hypothetical protein
MRFFPAYEARSPPNRLAVLAQPRGMIATALTLVAFVLVARSVHRDANDGGDACRPFIASLATRHTRRHRRVKLVPLVEAIPAKFAASRGDERRLLRNVLQEARCQLMAPGSSADQLKRAVARAAAYISDFDSNVADSGAADAADEPHNFTIGRRLGRRLRRASLTRRVTRGLGLFAGDDFPCDSDRDAFVGAPWARGACLMKCSPGSSPNAPRCPNAIAVCERRPECATVDINVEGSVATLKRETERSQRTSGVKDVDV